MHGFRVSAPLVGLSLIFTASGLAPASAQGNAPPLGAYNADIKKSSISGISSGADMAVQYGVSWSSTIIGVGVIAGSPYYCVQGTAAEGLSGNLVPDLMVTGPCMKGPPPALGPLIAKTDEWARHGDIDDTRNIAHQRVYIFSGYNDAFVNPKVVDATYQFYLHYLPDQSKGNLFYQNAIGAGHSQVTVGYGLACTDSKEYYIDKCNYDQAGILLQHIYGALNPPNKGELSGQLLPFNQREFTFPESPGSYSMAEMGFVYVPASCAAQQRCRVHIALHGCEQNFNTVGDRYTRHAGYNEWADTNQLIILYPQTIVGNPLTDFGTPENPIGCWDWWGYTNFNYAVKAGRQVTAIKTMLDRLTSAYAQNPAVPAANPAAPSGIVVNDVSDVGAAIAWNPVAGSQEYNVYRASSGGSFTGLGSVTGPSFGDMGLRPATSYTYKVTATTGNGSEGPSSPVVTATTLSVPPRCDTPGSCPLP
jgi:poly(3-hydroxybutyrate) depolymerase